MPHNSHVSSTPRANSRRKPETAARTRRANQGGMRVPTSFPASMTSSSEALAPAKTEGELLTSGGSS
eukprot:12899921-Prorocentrum_lima.AAC.1